MRFLEKYVIIKIKDHKIVIGMSILSSKLDEVNPMSVNIIQSCDTFLYFINLPIMMHFFLKNT